MSAHFELKITELANCYSALIVNLPDLNYSNPEGFCDTAFSPLKKNIRGIARGPNKTTAIVAQLDLILRRFAM